MTSSPADGARVARPRVGLVTSRQRLCAALARPLHDAPALLVEQVAAAAATGVDFVQVREPDLDGGPLLALVRLLVDAAKGRVRIVVNERADVAAAAGAALHLKASSMPAGVLRPWLPAKMWLSRAVHDAAEAAAAGAVDALVAGTFRDTASKEPGTPRLGTAGVTRIVAASGGRPVFVIGGVTAADWPALADTGAAGFAAIGWLLPQRGDSAGGAVARAMNELRAVVDGGNRVS